MRLLRLCLLILALRLFLSDPIMCYDVVLLFLFWERGCTGSETDDAVTAAALGESGSQTRACVIRRGRYETIFWAECQAESVPMAHFFVRLWVKPVLGTMCAGLLPPRIPGKYTRRFAARLPLLRGAHLPGRHKKRREIGRKRAGRYARLP